MSDDDMQRPRGRPLLPVEERSRRARERDRIKKREQRSRGLVQRYLNLTPVQAGRLDRHRVHGGFRTTSDLIAALVDRMPDRP
ncbi:hypothetical protein D3272_15545 [Lichenibacterium ramalinae]|uniref:Uncharacterized protein n=1 Tax=Lichenibacterium ramalinae TaxID=2316527 RepID=A0A4Q2RE11_9HYPH|nr:hypothetical protein D3272_15545 [Lichenibacterium ramalinae]